MGNDLSKEKEDKMEELSKQREEGMKELAAIAKAYYHACSEDIKELVRTFFKLLDVDEDGKVSFSEYMDLQDNFPNGMKNREFFNVLDRDKDEFLNFREVRTLFYILISGRPFCRGCGYFITGVFFTCTKCFESDTDHTYCVCLKCYGKRRKREELNHEHDQFIDNTAIIHFMRNSVIKPKPQKPKAEAETAKNKRHKMQQTQTPNTTTTIVPYPRPNNKIKYEWLGQYLILVVEACTAIGAIGSAVSAGCNIM